VDRTKPFVFVTKYFCYPYFNKRFCWYNKTFYTMKTFFFPIKEAFVPSFLAVFLNRKTISVKDVAVFPRIKTSADVFVGETS